MQRGLVNPNDPLGPIKVVLQVILSDYEVRLKPLPKACPWQINLQAYPAISGMANTILQDIRLIEVSSSVHASDPEEEKRQVELLEYPISPSPL